MEAKILGLMYILLVACVSGLPAGKARKAWHPHPLNHQAKRTSEPVEPIAVPLPLCEVAGSDLDSLLAEREELMGYYATIFEPVFEMMMNYSIDEFRGSDLFCALEGVDSIDELYHRLETANGEYYMFRAFRMGYIYGVIAIAGMRYHAIRTLARPDINDEYREEFEERLALLNDLQSSGITEFDPEGYQEMFDLFLSMNPSMLEDWPQPEPLSDLPLEAQCARLTNDFRKVWNREIIYASINWRPDAATYYREVLRNVTGIDIPTGAQTHQVMKDTFCQLIEPSALGNLYERMYDMGILPSIFRFLYHKIVKEIDMFEDRPPPHYYYSDEGPDDGASGVSVLVQNLLNDLRAMGLLDLQ